QFNFLCNEKTYCVKIPKRRFFLAYEGNTYKQIADEFGLIQKEDKNNVELNLIKETSKFICEILNKGKNTIMDKMEICNLEYRQLCLKLVSGIRENPFMNSNDLINMVKSLFEENPYSSVHGKVKDDTIDITEEFINKVNFNMHY